MAANRRAEVDKALADVDFTKNKYQVEFDTTMGKILLDVYPDIAPGHAKNLIGLTKIGFYKPVLEPNEITGPFTAAGLAVTPIAQDHGFSQTLGFRIGKFAYSTDVVELSDAAFAAQLPCFAGAAHVAHLSDQNNRLGHDDYS